jgi:hypothetical protein
MTAPNWEPYRVVTVGPDPEDAYNALQEAFIDRIEELNVSRITVNEAGGFTSGYSEKLLCVPPMKTLGKGTLGNMLKATGLALIVVVDDERFAAVKAQMAKRKRSVPPSAGMKQPAWLFTKKRAREMGLKRWSKLNPAQRTRLARRAAKARWSKQNRALAYDRTHPVGGASLKAEMQPLCADGHASTLTSQAIQQAQALVDQAS